jgi:hypothetical protein
MLAVKKILVLLITVLSIEPWAAQSQGIQDSLLLEKAFKMKDSGLVMDLLNRWHLEDLSVKDAAVTDTALLVKKIYETFINKFLEKRLQGYYSHTDRKPDGSSYGGTGLCRFSLPQAPFLMLQDQIKYGYSPVDINEADFKEYIQWKTDDNGLMPKSVADPDKLYALDGQLQEGRQQPVIQPLKITLYKPTNEFWERLQIRHQYKAILYRYNTERQNRLVRFIGYDAMGPGYILTFRAIDENSTPYKEREERLDFLNSILKFNEDCEGIVAGNYPLGINRIEFITGSSLVLIKYSVDACFYMCLFDLKRIDDDRYSPLSVFEAIA